MNEICINLMHNMSFTSFTNVYFLMIVVLQMLQIHGREVKLGFHKNFGGMHSLIIFLQTM